MEICGGARPNLSFLDGFDEIIEVSRKLKYKIRILPVTKIIAQTEILLKHFPTKNKKKIQNKTKQTEMLVLITIKTPYCPTSILFHSINLSISCSVSLSPPPPYFNNHFNNGKYSQQFFSKRNVCETS